MQEVTSEKSKPPRLLELDALRGLAALWVLLFHYTQRFHALFKHKDELWFTAPRGNYGVFLFFLISGYVVFMTLERAKRPLDFAVSRFSRLYPTYWICVLITAAVTNLAGLPRRAPSLERTLYNLSMLQEFFGVRNVDGVYWTLSVELSFYFLLFLLLCSKKLKHVEHFVLAAMLLVFANYIGQTYFDWRIPDRRLSIVFLLRYAHFFGAGIAFYKMRQEGFTRYRMLLAAFAVALVWLMQPAVTAAIISALFAVFFLATRGSLPFLQNRALVFLGTISYPLYLLHQNLGYVALRALKDAGVNSNIAVIACAAGAIALAAAVTYAVEKPVMKAIRSWYIRRPEPERAKARSEQQAAANLAANS